MAATDEQLPGWALDAEEAEAARIQAIWPHPVTREWAWGGSTGRGVRVCVVDSGVDADHPLVGRVERSLFVSRGEGGQERIVEDSEGDTSGHGNASAAIIRSFAPDCELGSVRVLGHAIQGTGDDLIAGLRWAIDQGYDVINLSLSTTHRRFVERLHELADRAYFRRSTLVCSAHNMPVDSWPWRFASVVSVAGHPSRDREDFRYNPDPPVEFLAPGEDIEVAWTDGSTVTASGNSFATAHLSGVCTRILGKHPALTPFELKSVLYLTATNVVGR
jgi:subtilisin